MVLYQFHAVLSEASAVSNEILALHELFVSNGHRSRLFSETKGRLAEIEVDRWPPSSASHCDLLLVHYSRGSHVHDAVFSFGGRKAIVFHNVTPASYFTDETLREFAERGLADLPRYSGQVDAALAHSRFSARILSECGFREPSIAPYLLHEPVYLVSPDATTLTRLSEGGWHNLLAVGRIAPNKCLEDCLFVLDYLRTFHGPGWRLFFVGSPAGNEVYQAKLKLLIERMRARDAEFTGEVSQAELLAYYQAGHSLLFLSEHEGFGVPLVEAMRMNVPVFAFATNPATEVLGPAGIQFATKDSATIGEAIAMVAADPLLREQVLSRQNARYQELSRGGSWWEEWLTQFSSAGAN
jgi:glycosyltransferase involved in cell wall biosynthesis